ncbi:MAG: putative (3R)-hydroxymyristoyl-[acyl-carrier-protein] dehydratase [Phycisphaerales bacterium]|nr:putative (3R)-hydroxymyristoyl-[acyl-carrier-protein] dehydratase [Phycisphaerales bacterium]
MSTPRPQTLEQIKTLLRRDLKLGDSAIPDDMPFFGTDVDLDSLDILLLMTSIEKQFKVKIPSEAVGKQVFQNVSTLAAYVDDQLGGAAGPTAGAGPVPPRPVDYLQRLPHSEPFRFVSHVVAITESDSGEAEWLVSGEEAFFAGHFPGNPVVPGVLIAEALAQLSGLVGPDNGLRGGKLAHMDVRFEQAVAPPAQITLRSKLLRAMGELQQFEVSASVGETVVARGTLALSRPAGQP